MERAQFTLETFSRAPEMEAFRNLIRDARGVFVAPQVLKGAFVVGAAGGSGVLVSRDRLKGQWAGPAFYTIGEVSFGLQIGGSASEVVLLAMTDRGVNALLETSAKLGADVGCGGWARRRRGSGIDRQSERRYPELLPLERALRRSVTRRRYREDEERLEQCLLRRHRDAY